MAHTNGQVWDAIKASVTSDAEMHDISRRGWLDCTLHASSQDMRRQRRQSAHCPFAHGHHTALFVVEALILSASEAIVQRPLWGNMRRRAVARLIGAPFVGPFAFAHVPCSVTQSITNGRSTSPSDPLAPSMFFFSPLAGRDVARLTQDLQPVRLWLVHGKLRAAAQPSSKRLCQSSLEFRTWISSR